MKNLMKRLWNDDEAANAVEYGLIAALIAVALITALIVFRQEIAGLFQRSGNKIRGQT
jgi:pilus assembly protein Flp/PilA